MGDESGTHGGLTRPDAQLSAPDLTAVEAAIRRAIDARRPEQLTLIGNGEMSVALRWTVESCDWVVKRVPPFSSRARADDYVATTRWYIEELGRRGVRCVATDLLTLDRADGSAVVYHSQPLLESGRLANNQIREAEPDPEHPILVAVVDAIVRVVDNDFGFDAQFANWFWFEDEPWQLDFSTPLLYDGKRRVRFDVGGFRREYPAPVRPLVYRELMKVATRYTEADFVLTDLMTQLYRENLDAWCEPVIVAARQRHGIEVSATVARQRFDEEAAFYPRLLRLKRLQRTWVQRTGRRYDSLLPATTGFGR